MKHHENQPSTELSRVTSSSYRYITGSISHIPKCLMNFMIFISEILYWQRISGYFNTCTWLNDISHFLIYSYNMQVKYCYNFLGTIVECYPYYMCKCGSAVMCHLHHNKHLSRNPSLYY